VTIDRTTTGDTDAEVAEEPTSPERRTPADDPGAEGSPSRADSRKGAVAANETASEERDAKPVEDRLEAPPPATSAEGVIEDVSEETGPADQTLEGANAEASAFGASSSEDPQELDAGQAQDDAAEARDAGVTRPTETSPDESAAAGEAADLSRDARRAPPEDEEPSDDPPGIVVSARAGHRGTNERAVSTEGSSSTDRRSAPQEVSESNPTSHTDLGDSASHEGAETRKSATDSDPVVGDDGAWEWKGLRLDPEENHIADIAHSERRIAEGRDEAGNYGDHGITPAMRRIEEDLAQGDLIGCPDFSLKGEDRFKEKLAKKIADSPGLPAREVADRIHDGIRYTFVFEPERYSDGVRQARERLEEEGYSLEIQRPTWDDPDYKGLNSRWRDTESGQLFEVQFHTPQSWDAKQKTHDAYEEMAAPTTPPEEIARLQAYQREVTASVVIPPGALEIPYYEKKA
jgi:hypothetical protein